MTVQDADDGDTTTSIETVIEAAEPVEAVRPDGKGIEGVVGDKGHHSNQSLVDFEASPPCSSAGGREGNPDPAKARQSNLPSRATGDTIRRRSTRGGTADQANVRCTICAPSTLSAALPSPQPAGLS